MKFSRVISAFAAVTILAISASSSFAQTTATQSFTVVVPQSLAITAPANISLNHDLTNNNQSFAAQSWNVRGNTTTGLSVNFAVAQPFTNTTNNAFMRDVQLGLATGATTGPATWSVTKATGSTNYAAGTQTANVAATSNGVGSANMLLSVTFLTGDVTTIAAGNYVTTVTGTVTAN